MNKEFYIACSDLNFDFSNNELLDFRQMWNEGYSLDYIALTLGRDRDEIGILAIDQYRKGEIDQRKTHGRGITCR